MLRTFGAAAVAATVVFIWGFVYWAVLPTGMAAVQGAPDGPALQAYLDQALPESGTYVVPFTENPTEDTAYHQAHSKGPLALVQFRKNGAEPMSTGTMLRGWLVGFASCLLMALVVRLAAGDGGFGRRFIAAFGGGAVGSVMARMGDPVWWYQPIPFARSLLFYEIVAWLLAGIVLGLMLRSAQPRISHTQL